MTSLVAHFAWHVAPERPAVMTMLTLDALFAQPDNAPVLRWMERDLSALARRVDPAAPDIHWPEDIRWFEFGTKGHPLDEGGCVLFHTYGRRMPQEARCCLELYNLLVHERTARIFAMQWGRYTFALRRDFSRWDVPDSDSVRIGGTIDGSIDVRGLGPGWALYDKEDDEDAEPVEEFQSAYELAGR